MNYLYATAALAGAFFVFLFFSFPAKAEEDAAQRNPQIEIEKPDVSSYPIITLTANIASQNGEPLSHLGFEDFQVTINSKPVTITNLPYPDSSLITRSVVIALDSSFKRNAREEWHQMKQIAKHIENKLFELSLYHTRYVVFGDDVQEYPNWNDLPEEPSSDSYTALFAAIKKSIEVVRKPYAQNLHTEEIIVIANSGDNTYFQGKIPPSIEELKELLHSRDPEDPVAPKLTIICYGLSVQTNQPSFANPLYELVQASGNVGTFVTPPNLISAKSEALNAINFFPMASIYQLSFATDAPVDQLHSLQLTVRGTQQETQFNPLSVKLPLTISLPAGAFASGLKEGSQLIAPDESGVVRFELETGYRKAPVTVQIDLNGILSTTYRLDDQKSQLRIDRLVPDVHYTLLITTTDAVGNHGRNKQEFQVAHPLHASTKLSDKSGYGIGKDDIALVYTMTLQGEAPISYEINASYQITPLKSEQITTSGESITTSVNFPNKESYTYPSANCSGSSLEWYKTKDDASSILQSMMTPLSMTVSSLGCMYSIQQAMITGIFSPTLEITQTITLTYTIIDSLGQKESNINSTNSADITPLIIEVVPDLPTFPDRLWHYRNTIVVDLGIFLLMLWLAKWFRRRVINAHQAIYTLEITNLGNFPTAYAIRAMQPVKQSNNGTDEVLSIPPNLLHFEMFHKEKRIESAELRKPTQLKAQNMETVGRSTSTLPEMIATPSDTPMAQFDLNQALQEPSAQEINTVKFGESLYFISEIVEPGQLLSLTCNVRTQHRHLWRKTYRFIIYSQPQKVGAQWRRETEEEFIRFGFVLNPRRTNKLASRQKASANSSLGNAVVAS